MNIDTKLISAAENLFDRHGFNATGMDRLAQAAGMSSRTLYKHAGSKNELIAAVLMTRGQRFLQRLEVDSVEALFDALAGWMSEEGRVDACSCARKVRSAALCRKSPKRSPCTRHASVKRLGRSLPGKWALAWMMS